MKESSQKLSIEILSNPTTEREGGMSNQKVYFSKLFDPNDWSSADDFLTFYLIPNKWWSIRSWKFANSMRSRILNTLIERIQP